MTKYRIYGLCALLLITLGFFLRLSIYQADHGLWLDEANTAQKIYIYDLSKIAQIKGSPYSTGHAYPIGFMAALKVSVLIFGTFNLVLRLFPVLCSLTAILLFWKLGGPLFPKPLALLPLLLFCTNTTILQHSSELKPYASDVLAVIILLNLFIKYSQRKYLFKDAAFFSAAGFIVIYFSFPAIPILLASAGILFIDDIRRKKWDTARMWGGLLTVWGVGLSIFYLYSLRFVMKETQLFQYWAPNFFPWSSDPFENLRWIASSTGILMNHLQCPQLITFLFIALGLFVVFKKNYRIGLLLCVPLCTVFLLAIFKFYPLHGRTTTFLIPNLILVFSYGMSFFFIKEASLIRKILGTIALITVLITAFVPLRKLSSIGAHSEDMRMLLQYLHKNFVESTDGLVINNNGHYTFTYYSHFFAPVPSLTNVYVACDSVEHVKERRCVGLVNSGNGGLSLMCLPFPEIQNNTTDGQKKERFWILLSHYQPQLKDFLNEFFEQAGYVLKETTQQEENFLLLYMKQRNE